LCSAAVYNGGRVVARHFPLLGLYTKQDFLCNKIYLPHQIKLCIIYTHKSTRQSAYVYRQQRLSNNAKATIPARRSSTAIWRISMKKF